MKKLESLNNSLFEKFENNKVNNLALCLGGDMVTKNSAGADTFVQGGTTRDKMYMPNGSIYSGDYYSK